MAKNILIVTYLFPPPIDGGTIRIYKLSNYLAKFGHRVFVLCGNTPTDDIEGLDLRNLQVLYTGKDISSGMHVESRQKQKGIFVLLKSIIKYFVSYLLIDKFQLIWNKTAIKNAGEIIDTYKIDVIITSSPPHSTHLIGWNLKKKYKDITWIADFRDLWSLSHNFDLNIARNRMMNRYFEARILQCADSIVVVSDSIRAKTEECFSSVVPALKDKITVITNGYDEADFGCIDKIDRCKGVSDKIKFSYVGTLFNALKNNKLVEAANRVCEESDSIEFNFIGSFDDDYVNRAKCANIKFLDRLPHDQALLAMKNSDVLILILTDDEEGKMAFSGKFFEYLRIGRPILALVPNGEVSGIIQKYHLGECVNPNDLDGIYKAILKITSFATGCCDLQIDDELLCSFSREKLAKKYEQLFL